MSFHLPTILSRIPYFRYLIFLSFLLFFYITCIRCILTALNFFSISHKYIKIRSIVITPNTVTFFKYLQRLLCRNVSTFALKKHETNLFLSPSTDLNGSCILRLCRGIYKSSGKAPQILQFLLASRWSPPGSSAGTWTGRERVETSILVLDTIIDTCQPRGSCIIIVWLSFINHFPSRRYSVLHGV